MGICTPEASFVGRDEIPALQAIEKLGFHPSLRNLRFFSRLRPNTRHSGESRNPVKYVVRSTQNLLCRVLRTHV